MSSRHKVLVVETQRYRTIIRNVLERDSRLRTLNIKVVEALNGQDALVQFENERPTLVITELLVSKLSGFEVVRKIREDLGGKDVPILVTTALAGETTTLSLLERRYGAHIQFKPFPPWALAQQVRSILTKTSEVHKAARVSEAKAEMARRKSKPKLRSPLAKSPSLIDITLPVEEKPVASKVSHTTTGPIRILDSDTVSVTNKPPTSTPAPSRSPATKPQPSPPTTPRRMRRGSLEANPLPMLLLDALEQQLSGVLTISHDKVKKVIYIERGVPIFVQSNLRRETIGQSLVRKGMLNAAENSQVLNLSKESKVPYGKAVVQLGLLDQQTFDKVLQRNIAYKLECSLDWRAGTWLFLEDQHVGRRVPRCTVDLPRLVLEGLKEKSNAETALHRLAARQDQQIRLLPRFERYRRVFVSAFSDRLVRLFVDTPEATLGQLIQGMGSPFEAVLQLDILFKLAMARMVTPSRKPAVDEVPTAEMAHPDGQAKPTGDEPASGLPPTHKELPVVRDVPTQSGVPTADTGVAARGAVETGPGISSQVITPINVPRPPGLDDPSRGFQSDQLAGRRLVQSTYLALHHRTHYELLGLSPNCDEERMEQAYAEMRQKFAPANLGDDLDDLTQHLKAIHQALDMAYLVLADPSARSEYDDRLAGRQPDAAG